MWRNASAIGIVGLILFIAAASAASAQVDSAASQDLTAYLRAHRFPLVGASVTHAGSGATQVILYGYVASDQGKQNANARVAEYYHSDPSVMVLNRISVNPEIRNLSDTGSSGVAAENTTANAGPGTGLSSGQPAYSGAGLGPDETQWENVYKSIQKYGIHPAPDPSSSSAPW
jgi:opacity protein-like surface antigen